MKNTLSFQFIESFFQLILAKNGCVYPEEIHEQLLNTNTQYYTSLCYESIIQELQEMGIIEFKASTYYTLTRRGETFHQFIEFQRKSELKTNFMKTNKVLLDKYLKTRKKESINNLKLNILIVLVSISSMVLLFFLLKPL